MAKLFRLTFIEWLCVGLILGVLAALALPEFLSGKPRKVCATVQSWAKTIVGSALKVQEAHHIEQGGYMTALAQVEQAMRMRNIQSQYWQISMQTQGNAVLMYATALPFSETGYPLHSYVAELAYDEQTGEYVRIICKTTQPSSIAAKAPILERKRYPRDQKGLRLRCAEGTHNC